MDARSAQATLLDDVLFTLVKNKETFSFDKLSQLFPLLSKGDITKAHQNALANRTLLDRVMAEKANLITFTAETEAAKPSPVESNIPIRKKFPPNYVPSTAEPIVTIHVLDDSNDKKADFQCGRELLVAEMAYFGDYLPVEESALSEIDISVHCDIAIFSLLMDWVKRYEKEESFQLARNNLIPVLVSADFLQIESLVNHAAKEAAEFVSEINLTVLSRPLIAKIGESATAAQVDQIQDDEIREAMYKQLVLTEATKAKLFKCASCKCILPWQHRSQLKCLAKNVAIDKKGNVKWKHTVDSGWEFAAGQNNELSRMLDQNIKLVYWKLWGLSRIFRCTVCDQVFQASDIKTCHYHPRESQLGVYPCCKKSRKDFNPMMGRNGCRKRYHTVTDPTLNAYLEFTGIVRDLPEAPIGPVWKEKPATEPTSLWHVGKSLRWNQDNIRDAERRQFRLDSESCSLGSISNIPPAGIYVQLERDRAPPKMHNKSRSKALLY